MPTNGHRYLLLLEQSPGGRAMTLYGRTLQRSHFRAVSRAVTRTVFVQLFSDDSYSWAYYLIHLHDGIDIAFV